MMLIGKNVPERNIIGKVTMLPITPAVSGFLVTVPTNMPSDAKSIGPKMRKGISQAVNVTLCAESEDSHPDHEQKASDCQNDVPHYLGG